MAEKLHGARGRLVKTYLILVGAATRRQTILYADLASQTGVAVQGVGQLCLNPVYQFCKDNGYPDLSVLVVSRNTGEPAEGHFDPATLYLIREEVYAFPWMDYAPPETASMFTL